MEQTLEFTRGDTCRLKFKRLDRDKQVIEHIPNKLYFTVKKNHLSNDVVFQKTLGNGITYDDTDKYYHIKINPDDTNGLPYYKYVFDIEVITDSYKQTIASGAIILKQETTFVGNEV